MKAPFYDARDYACSVGHGAGWSEAITSITNRGSATFPEIYNEQNPTPACGTDYFVRIREGASDYEWMKFCANVTTNVAVDAEGGIDQSMRMELVTNHTWRCHYYVATNAVGQMLRFHFQGKELYRESEDSFTYLARTNTFYSGSSSELPRIPHTAVATAEGNYEIQVRLDGVGTHLLVEFNDELRSFSVSHAVYQNFNAWTDALEGFRGNAVYNPDADPPAEGTAISGVADAKKLYTAEMGDWIRSAYTDSLWVEPFTGVLLDDNSYPYDVHMSVTNTPNGWNAENGAFVRGSRTGTYIEKVNNVNKTFKSLGWMMDGEGKGSISLVKKAVPGLGKVGFSARISQVPKFENFSTYFDGTRCTNYAVSAQLSMSRTFDSTGKYSPLDISPCQPSLSVVGYYLGSKGCYELRLTRSDELKLTAELYKWQQDSTGDRMVATLLKSQDVTRTNSESKPNLLVPYKANSGSYNSSNCWTTVLFSIYNISSTQTELQAWLSKEQDTKKVTDDSNLQAIFSSAVIDSSNPLRRGTFGVGACDCTAAFGQILVHKFGTKTTNASSFYGIDRSVGTDNVPGSYADDWNFMNDRWGELSGLVRSTVWTSGLVAKVPASQTVQLYTAEASGTGQKNWVPLAGCVTNISTFATNTVTFAPHSTETVYVQLRTGNGDSGVTVDDLVVESWKAQDLDTSVDPSAERWAYTEGTVVPGSGAITNYCTLQPTRGVFEDRERDIVYPMGLRSPYLANGLSLMSLDYVNADSNCVLWLQVCTNCTSAYNAEMYSKVPPSGSAYAAYGWETKYVFRFGSGPSSTTTPVRTNVLEATKANLKAGSFSSYVSMRAPAKGLMRVVVAPEVMSRAISSQGPGCDVDYGKITITGISCYDEPAIDDRAWYGWNLHTVGWNTIDKSYAYLTDSPSGLSCMLNFSALDSENRSAAALGMGLADANKEEYKKENPFIQCPPIGENNPESGIGKVSFRARTYTNAQEKSSWVTVFGTPDPGATQSQDPGLWEELARFEITNRTYQTYTWTLQEDRQDIKTVRLEVNGARHGRSQTDGTPESWEWLDADAKPIQRVLIDEISVSEAIKPGIVLRDVRPFRSHQLREMAYIAVSNVTEQNEQPITGESWGLQVTVEPQQMSDEIDLDSIKVFASVYAGISPWGYQQWSNRVGAVELPRMGDTLVFRSHMSAPGTIYSPVEKASTVQYMVWAEYEDKQKVSYTHYLKASDWTPPKWYFGLDDYNLLYGSGLAERFSGYTIFDSISPKRAWLNEVNIQNTRSNDESEDKRNQFIECAVPQRADLTGWSLEVTGNTQYSNAVLAVFGYDDAAGEWAKGKVGTRQGVDFTNSYTFVALRSPATTEASVKAACDGVWKNIHNADAHVDENGSLRGDEPYGIALVRPSGIIEHQVVVEGRNAWEGSGLARFEYMYSGTNMLAQLVKRNPKSAWFFAGRDLADGTLGVYRSHGEDATCWTNRMESTPGQINRMEDGTVQDIDPDWFLRPNGTNVWIYAYVNSPYIEQVIAGETNRTAQVIVLAQGSSTNILYNVDKWYAIGSLTTNGVEVAGARGKGGAPTHRYSLRLDNVRENITVNVGDQANAAVTAAGLDPDDPYYPAVMHWLRNSGAKDDSQVYTMEFWPTQTRPARPVKLGIKDCYWLDVPVDEPGWVLVGGMGALPGQGEPSEGNDVCKPKFVPYDASVGRPATNVVVTVTMMITNTATDAAHAPKRLQGLEIGSRSDTWNKEENPEWTSCTFKIKGALQKPGCENDYRALRWFVLGPDSFDENFKARIEIRDPFLHEGENYGWTDFHRYQIFYRWSIDDKAAGTGSVEMLKSDSTY